MKYFCEALTGGGPVAIMLLREACKWNGGFGDYFRAIESHLADGGLQYFEIDERCQGCLFHHVDDGDFVVYYDTKAVLLLSGGCTEEHSLADILPDYESYIVPSPSLQLPNFGGQIAIFDSAYPGNLISLKTTGHQTIDFSSDPDDRIGSPMIPNAMVVEVEKGLWEAVEIHRNDTSACFDGVLFRHVG